MRGLFTTLVASLMPAVGFAAPGNLIETRSTSFPTFANHTVFTPPANYRDPRVLYARTVELENGDILATWENYSPEPPMVYFPVYKSRDGGSTWKELSRIQDQVNGWGLRYQPDLYRLPASVGKFPKGTILAAGSSIPSDLSKTQLVLYASNDDGKTWKFVSSYADGGAAEPVNGVPAVWEPFLLYHKGQLIIYYSDQRDPKYGQKLVHTTSSDLYTWSALVDDVHYPTYTDRPGMTTVTRLPNGKFMMTYEYGGGPRKDGQTNYDFPVYYRIAADPLKFLDAPGLPIYTNDKIMPRGSPYITWTPVGGKDGTIIVSCGTATQVFVNQKLGDVNSWKTVPTPEGVSYTRSLRVLKDSNHLLIMGGGYLPPALDNKVTVSVIDVIQSLKSSS